MDDGGNWASAVAGVWPDADIVGLLLAYLIWECSFYAAWVPRHVRGAVDPVDYAGLPLHSNRPCRRARSRCSEKPDKLEEIGENDGLYLVLAGCGDAGRLCGSGWLRYWRGNPVSSVGTDRRTSAHDDTVHWAGVGRERGVVDCERRDAVLRISSALCLGVQRILSAADDRAVAADSARYWGRTARTQ